MSASAATRMLPLRARADLRSQPFHLRGRGFWSVKDPLTLRYYQLREEEYFLLQQLRTPVSLAQLQERFEARFAPGKLSLTQLQSFLGMLHREGLVVADAPGQGATLYERRRKQRRGARLGRYSNVLAIRFRGVDPDAFLTWLHDQVRWMFRWWFLAACALFVLSAAVFALIHIDEFTARLPDASSLFSFKTLIWLMAAIGVSKVLHELAHGLACKNVGGECHELGLMFLVFAPCLYCNVTDTWMTPGKWRRASVSAAGVAVELVLAAAAFFLWWYSQPGLFNSACFSLMAVCSLNSLLFNGNPLLRYDGYFVLADLLEIPNLGQRSTHWMRRAAARWGLGIELEENPLHGERRWWILGLYGVASLAYRLFVVGMILWMVHRALAPMGLETLAWALAALVITGLVAPLAWKLGKFVSAQEAHSMKWNNATVTAMLLLATLGFVFNVPIPHRVGAAAVVRPTDAALVYAGIDGELVESARVGDKVRDGDQLGKLRDRNLEREIVVLEGKQQQQALHVEHLERRGVFDPQAEEQLPSARQALAELDRQLRERREDVRRLTLTAPRSGVVLPPPPRRAAVDSTELPEWTGAPLDPENDGCFLRRGDLFCLVGDPNQIEALLVVHQSDMQFLRPGLAVRLQFDQLAGRIIEGETLEVSELDLQQAPPELVAAGELPAQQDRQGGARPAMTSYQVRVRLNDQSLPLTLGATGHAHIHSDSKTLAQRILHFFGRTFQLELLASTGV